MAAARILDARAALVTGASRGIGRSIALALAEAGASVVVTYKNNLELAAEVVDEIRGKGGQAEEIQMNLERRESIARAICQTRENFGALDILVNNAALAQAKPFEELTDADWDEMLACNLRSAFVSSQLVLPAMMEAGFGRIINVSSVGGQWGGVRQVHYAASKAALISLTMSIAKLFSSRGVTCNAVAPGLIETDMASQAISSETERGTIAAIPVGRVGSPREVAEVVVFLASEAAGYVTGQTINVNGGMYFG